MILEVLGFIAIPVLIAWVIVRPHKRSTGARVAFAIGVALLAFYAADWLTRHPV